MKHGVERLELSERRACRFAGQNRATQRKPKRLADDEVQLVKDMEELSRKHPRFGYRMICALLRRDGWKVNRKRVQRLWTREGMQVPRKFKKRPRLGNSSNSCFRHRAECMNHVWTYDFVFDRTEDGRKVRFLTLVDEYTRECLKIHAARSITSKDLIAIIAERIKERGAPAFIRSDNGPEFIATGLRKWLERIGVKTLFVAPGSPWENGYIESFNSKLRNELLNGEIFISMAEAKHLAKTYENEYNENRPHSGLGYLTPAQFAASCGPADFASLNRRAHSSPQTEQAPTSSTRLS